MSRRRAAWLGWMLGCLLAAPSAWAQDQPIYTDALVNGWENWSWAVVNTANGSPVHSGTSSASVAADAWEAIYLHHAAFDTSGYAALVFWIHGGAGGGQLLQVQALLDGTARAAVALSPLPANTWQQVTIPLATLGVASRPNMDGFWIQDRSGTTKPAFYVDDVRLTAAAPPAVVNVTVDASQPLRTVDARHFGVNAAMWDDVFDTPTTIGLLGEMGNRALRFPGGSLSNDYHWQTNTTDANTWQWPTSFDDFAHVAAATGAHVFISVNYGSGTPAEAAEWVRYANVTRGYGVKYWEIGNENYGDWETDLNVRPHDPHTYANRFKQYYDQMKAVDPTIKVGAVAVTGEDTFSTYGDHPATNPRTGQAHNGWTPVMLATLASLGVTPDFLIHHRYAQAPFAESDAGLLQSSSTWGADAGDLRRQLTDYLGAAGAGVELVCTENNSVFTQPGKQTTSLVNGLFLADSLGAAMKTEFNAVLWWDLRNGPDQANNNAASLYGWRLYGDYGIVNDATPAGPADRYPPFYVAKLLQHFARGGDRLVEARSDSGLLSVYAARRADGSLTLLAINKSSTTTLNASIALRGYAPGGTVQTYSYGIPQDEAARTGVGSADVATSSAGSVGRSFAFAFPPYSVTVLSLNGVPSAICCRDFNGGGRADILWRHTSGTLAVWLLNGFSVVGAGVPGSVPSDWSVVGAGDFNGDGKADVLWRHTSGNLAIWLLDGATVIGAGLPGSVGNEWAVAGVADFNGDGKADILWRHTSGTLAVWLLNGFNVVGSGVLGSVAPEWTIAGVADFDGDGNADLLWQHTSGIVSVWLLNGLTVIGSGGPGGVTSGWTVAGVGDFNGDGKADILWSHPSGTVAIWLLNGSALIGSGVPGNVSSAWTVAGVGDFNGDGKADVLWRDTAGSVAMWLMNGAGIASQSLLQTVPTSWTIQ